MKKKELINEIMGVPSVLNTWVDYFSMIVTGMVKSISQSDEMDEAEVNYKNPDNPEEMIKDVAYRGKRSMDGKTVMEWIMKIGGYSDLKELLNDPKFKEFPLYKPSIGVTVIFIPDVLYNAEYGKYSDRTFDASHGWDPSNIKISKLGGNNLVFTGQEFRFNMMLPQSWIESFDTETFRKMSKATISHELTHGYETYMRFKTSGDPFMGREGFLNIALKQSRDEKYPEWNDFLHVLYLSLSFEINARIVQLYNTMKEEGVKDQNQFMDILKRSSVWDEINKLLNFKADKFIKTFTTKNLGFSGILNDLGNQMAREKAGLPSIGSRKNKGEAMKHLSDVWDKTLQKLNVDITNMLGDMYKGKFMDKVPASAKENPEKFFKFFEKRFHKKGEDFRRKALRLSSLLINGEEVEK